MKVPDAVARMYEAAPLMRFSLYTHGQVLAINEFGTEVLALLERSMSGHEVDGKAFQRAYNHFWLWVLGAFEIARTMCQAKRCFSPEFAGRICEMKGQLAVLRTPFAKQELAGRQKRFSGEASVVGLNMRFKDIRFTVDRQVLSAKEFIISFRELTESVQSSDVVRGING